MDAKPAAEQGRPPRRWVKRVVFALVTGVLVCALIEWIAWVAVWVTDGRMFRYERLREEIRAAARGSEGAGLQDPRQPSTIQLVPHPYMGFVYPPSLNKPEFEDYHRHPINAYGFVDSDPPIRKRDPGRVIIGIVGASVAYWFSALGDVPLVEELRKSPAFAEKEIEIVRLALGSMKEPQQLMTLNWVLSLGGEFDVVLNIDGYNEALIPEPENLRVGMHPHFPRYWNVLMQGTLSQEWLGLVGTVVKAKDDRRAWARVFEHSWMEKSILLGFVWKARDRLLAASVARSQQALNWYVPPKQPYAAVGPGVADYPVPLDREVTEYWRRCSELIDQVCTARGILYLHFLQPNQNIGEKPMGDAERAVAMIPANPLAPPLQRIYAAMIEAGAEMRASGIRFHDLTRIFDSVPEPVYIDNCCHMNRFGNAIMAKHIAQAIQDAWKDGRRQPTRPTVETTRGIAGSGAIIPTLSLAEPATLEQKSWKVRVSRGRGAATGQLCVTSAPVTDPVSAMKDPTTIPLVASIPIQLDGVADVPGSGNAVVEVPIPQAAPGTTTLYVRAVVIDSGSRLGFSVSNSLTLSAQ